LAGSTCRQYRPAQGAQDTWASQETRSVRVMASVIMTVTLRQNKAAGKRRDEMERRAKVQESKEKRRWDELFRQYDANGNGTLEREELAALLKHLDESGRAPTDAALDLLLKKAKPSEEADGNASPARVTREMLQSALVKYAAYLRQQELLDYCFEKYDVSRTGALNRSELANLMKDVTHDIGVVKPSQGDIDFVLQRCGGEEHEAISREECLAAIGVWRDLVEKQKYACCSPVCWRACIMGEERGPRRDASVVLEGREQAAETSTRL